MHCTRENWSASLLTCCLLSTADANLVVPNNILPRAVSVVICLVSSRLSIPGNLHSFPFRYHFVRHVCLLVLFVVAIYLRMSNLDARLYVATRCGSFFFPRRARQSPARKLYYFTFTLPFESLSSSLFSPIVPSDRKASQGLSQFCFPPLLRFYLPCFTLALQSLTLF